MLSDVEKGNALISGATPNVFPLDLQFYSSVF